MTRVSVIEDGEKGSVSEEDRVDTVKESLLDAASEEKGERMQDCESITQKTRQ